MAAGQRLGGDRAIAILAGIIVLFAIWQQFNYQAFCNMAGVKSVHIYKCKKIMLNALTFFLAITLFFTVQSLFIEEGLFAKSFLFLFAIWLVQSLCLQGVPKDTDTF